jgi:hydroxymethylpyrimidine kinase/phosphomethylpyrimidine kinase
MAASFPFPLVVDPVIVSKHGARLLSSDAEQALRTRLLPHCALVTPNIPEAEALSGITIDSLEDAEHAARRIAELGARAVLIKGGHLEGTPVDLLYTDGALRRLEGQRVQTVNTHGTGCTYSAAITALLARGEPLLQAVQIAKRYIQRAIETAPGLGSGSGPVNHFAEMDGSTSVSGASS